MHERLKLLQGIFRGIIANDSYEIKTKGDIVMRDGYAKVKHEALEDTRPMITKGSIGAD